ncbi:hypothetical protein D6D10_09344, partial [Aureobasidium pullulans]
LYGYIPPISQRLSCTLIHTLLLPAHILPSFAQYKNMFLLSNLAIDATFNFNATFSSNATFNFNTSLSSNATFNSNATLNNTRMVNDNFHPFPRLPLELREDIWRLCLPHRVYEMDEVNASIVWEIYGLEEDDIPCWLRPTSRSNARPPVLARVCRESRRVAFATGKWVSRLRWRSGACSHDGPREADWNTGNVIDRGFWQDTSRDSAHMHWIPHYDIDYGPTMIGHPLTSLAQEAKRLNGTASFMFENCLMSEWDGDSDPYDYPLEGIPIAQREQEDLAALKLLPEWMVVVRVVVIHLDFERAADSGLFGLLGDEPIQMVDATLPLASQLHELAEYCEREASAVTTAQDLTRMPANDINAMMKRAAFRTFHDREVGKRLRPAIMFRLCTQMCNHINTPGEEQNV